MQKSDIYNIVINDMNLNVKKEDIDFELSKLTDKENESYSVSLE